MAGTHFHDLVQTDIAGDLAYVSLGPDPRMILCDLRTRKRLRVAAGKYRFIFHARVLKGRLYRVRLYLNYGQGYSEAESSCVFLEKCARDVWYGDICCDRRIVEIRFDPSEAPVTFTIVRLALEEWGSETPSVSERIYAGLRTAFFALPQSWTRGRPIAWIAESAARSVFAWPRRGLRERALAAVTSVPVADIPRARKRNILADPSIYVDHYRSELSVSMGARDANFAPIATLPAAVPANDPKVLAFYLPQFHPCPENDEWWGRGFTEWTNVTKSVPRFRGHYQPRLPGELGYYDLRLPEIMARQFELARLFGVYGFCFHFYWFDGKRLLERPLELLLDRKDDAFDFPFCLCWANENWTRRWDGLEHDVLVRQNHSHDDHERVFEYLLRYFDDPRYIRVDGKPVIVIYRPLVITTIDDMVSSWRRKATEAGLPGIYLVATTAFGFSNPGELGFDALCQFPPHAVEIFEITTDLQFLDPEFSGCVYDYDEAVDTYVEILRNVRTLPRTTGYFPGVMTAWDNAARKGSRAHVFHGASPREFHRWLTEAIDFTRSYNRKSEQFVFVNAWNEWGEGTYLEPDRKFGYAYLWAVAAAQRSRPSRRDELNEIANRISEARNPASDAAVYLHIFYEDLVDEFAEVVALARQARALDVIVTIPETWNPAAASLLATRLEPTRLVIVENRGRDILPFFKALRATTDLRYRYGCKLHGKKSQHVQSGAEWRHRLVEGVAGPEALRAAFEAFERDPKSGLAAPREAFVSANDPSVMRDNRANVDMLLEQAGHPGAPLEDFVAGTMFWFRTEAFRTIATLPIADEAFGVELGAIDGTLAHAFERVLPTLVIMNGYSISRYADDGIAAAPY